MKKLIVLLGFVSCLFTAFAQTESSDSLAVEAVPADTSSADSLYSKFDFAWIDSFVTARPSAYDSLLRRFEEADTTLSYEEVVILYYGFVYTEKYNPMGNVADKSLCFKLMKKGKMKKALKVAERRLTAQPVSMRTLWDCLLLLSEQKKKSKEYDKLLFRYWAVASIIKSSGDGTSCNRGFCVNWVDDEYIFVDYLFKGEAKVKGQSLVNGDRCICDRLDVEKKGDSSGEEFAVYFDITEYFKKLNGRFGGPEGKADVLLDKK